ncbi:hypothetical protein [Niabella terrae]
MKYKYKQRSRYLLLFIAGTLSLWTSGQVRPDQIHFTRQAVRRFIFDEQHLIPLANIQPASIIGIDAMHPATHRLERKAELSVQTGQLVLHTRDSSATDIWLGGFNPFATYILDVEEPTGDGAMGILFTDDAASTQFSIVLRYQQGQLLDVLQQVTRPGQPDQASSILTSRPANKTLKGKIFIQLLGSGLTVYLQNESLPYPVAQSDFSQLIDLRQKSYLSRFKTKLLFVSGPGTVKLNNASIALSSGIGLADIRALTYEDGTPLLDQGRVWYTMSIRGRALPHHLQGIFSMHPTIFDLRFEGIVVFDRGDGLLRNEIASHIFFDRRDSIWRGITTGFSSFASPKMPKELLAIESKTDPRFGFSVMRARPFGITGDIEDPHILYDSQARKWRLLACENIDGYKAVLMESSVWNKGYRRIAGPGQHNATGTSIQRIAGVPYCFSGSDERKIFIYSYPDLKEVGQLQMDLPPWDSRSGTRVWPNIIELPTGYPFRYLALMMDRFNYPGLQGPNWTYGALYLYHGNID